LGYILGDLFTYSFSQWPFYKNFLLSVNSDREWFIELVPAASGQFCLEDGVVDENLNDPEFVRTQLNCVLYDEKCDNFGHRLKGQNREPILRLLNLRLG
jgi:hypothetical protein